VAEQLDWSPSKVIRIEAGTVGVSVTNLRAPFRTWVTQDFGTYLDYETSASTIRNFETNLVPGSLQTEEYESWAASGRALTSSFYAEATSPPHRSLGPGRAQDRCQWDSHRHT